VLSRLRSKTVEIDGIGSERVNPPWDLTANDYLVFARTDLKQGSRRALVNSLGNTKRALHCQVDSVLHAIGLGTIAGDRRWDFRTKTDVIGAMGIVTPSVLSRINRVRNEVEHGYSSPTSAATMTDLIDAVELFLAASQPFAEARFTETSWVWSVRGVERWVEVNRDGGDLVLRGEVDLRISTGPRYKSLLVSWYASARRLGAYPLAIG
jgi:hypothetical protein